MLTLKQQTFADSIAAGQTQAAAYRSAYDAADMAPATVWNEASKLVRHPEVSDRVDHLQRESALSAATRREANAGFRLSGTGGAGDGRANLKCAFEGVRAAREICRHVHRSGGSGGG